MRQPNRTPAEDLAEFGRIVDAIWGPGVCVLPGSTAKTNNVIGALNSSQFGEFRKNLIARLQRLAAAYPAAGSDKRTLLQTVSQLPRSTWAGAYSELVALDYFINAVNAAYPLTEGLTLNVDIDGTRTYARHMGKPGPANLDGQLSPYAVFFDVKAFKDNVREILTGVYDDVYRQLGTKDFTLSAEYPLALHYDQLQRCRQSLVGELVSAFQRTKRQEFLQSRVLPQFSFRGRWGAGVLMTTHEHEPYAYAEHYHRDVFHHADKFVCDAASIIVYVVFPWFNMLTTGFDGFNETFYRAFARRAFCQYRFGSDSMKQVVPSFQGPETVWQVSRDLSAILFLEDKSVLGESTEPTKIEAWWYVNPNANHSLTSGIFDGALRQVARRQFDTFRHDNY